MCNSPNDIDNFDTCGDCGDRYDSCRVAVSLNITGDSVCPDCAMAYVFCRACGVTYHEHAHCDCEYCMVCDAPMEGTQLSCADCVHDCAHTYTDGEPGCVRCGHSAPAPYSHLRLILGGKP